MYYFFEENFIESNEPLDISNLKPGDKIRVRSNLSIHDTTKERVVYSMLPYAGKILTVKNIQFTKYDDNPDDPNRNYYRATVEENDWNWTVDTLDGVYVKAVAYSQLKEGDKIKVRKDLTETGNYLINVSSKMLPYAGKILTVKAVDNNYVPMGKAETTQNIIVEENYHHWTPDMLEPIDSINSFIVYGSFVQLSAFKEYAESIGWKYNSNHCEFTSKKAESRAFLFPSNPRTWLPKEFSLISAYSNCYELPKDFAIAMEDLKNLVIVNPGYRCKFGNTEFKIKNGVAECSYGKLSIDEVRTYREWFKKAPSIFGHVLDFSKITFGCQSGTLKEIDEMLRLLELSKE